jgi:hypothetical protein
MIFFFLLLLFLANYTLLGRLCLGLQMWRPFIVLFLISFCNAENLKLEETHIASEVSISDVTLLLPQTSSKGQISYHLKAKGCFKWYLPSSRVLMPA